MRLAMLSFCAILTLATLSVGGCGVKPPDVDPPQGEERDHFPRTYPDPLESQQPHGERLIS